MAAASSGSSIGQAVALLTGSLRDAREGEVHLSAAYATMTDWRAAIDLAGGDSGRPSIVEAREYAERAHDEIRSAIALVGEARENIAKYRAVIAPGFGRATPDGFDDVPGLGRMEPSSGEDLLVVGGRRPRNVRAYLDESVRQADSLDALRDYAQQNLSRLLDGLKPPDMESLGSHTQARGAAAEPLHATPIDGGVEPLSAVIFLSAFAFRSGFWVAERVVATFSRHPRP